MRYFRGPAQAELGRGTLRIFDWRWLGFFERLQHQRSLVESRTSPHVAP